MTDREKEIYKIVARHFDYNGTSDFFELIADLVDRVDEDDFREDPYEAVYQACDEGLIYTSDQWLMLEHYCTPMDANFDDAWEAITADVEAVAEEYLGVEEE